MLGAFLQGTGAQATFGHTLYDIPMANCATNYADNQEVLDLIGLDASDYTCIDTATVPSVKFSE